MLDDLRQALRSIRKQPGFASVAVLTLAFGIGVNVSIFALVSALFLQPLRVKNAHEFVMVMQKGDIINVPYGYSFPDYLDYRKSVTTLTEPRRLYADAGAPERPRADTRTDVGGGGLPQLLRAGAGRTGVR